MKRFVLLHYGFEKPSPEVMAAWGKWFEAVADKTVEHGGFHDGAAATYAALDRFKDASPPPDLAAIVEALRSRA